MDPVYRRIKMERGDNAPTQAAGRLKKPYCLLIITNPSGNNFEGVIVWLY
jgi:hypothetical protein